MDFTFETFADRAVWDFLLQFFLLMGALLAANTVRQKISLVRKSLVPTALIGGLILLLLKSVPAVGAVINRDMMEAFTYHCLPIGFIALALKRVKGKKNFSAKTVMEGGVLQGAVYAMQGSLGLLVSIALSLLLPGGFFSGGGILLALGFGQGTGQALNYGKIYETDHGFVGGASFGLTVATVGFLVAAVVGVVYMNILRVRGKLVPASKKTGALEERIEDYVSENEIPNAESVDKLTVNMALILFVYGVTYAVMRLVNVNLVWGFNFLLGTAVAVGLKQLLVLFQKLGLAHRCLTNDYLLDRISGFFFDIMIVSGVAAIDLLVLSSMWLPLLILCVVGALSTFIYIRAVCNHIFKGYEDESFFAFFGMLTGTASSGMILLRELDPAFETPTASNLVFSGMPAIAFGGGLLCLLGYAPLGLLQASVSALILAVFAIVFTLVLYRDALWKGRKKGEAPKKRRTGARADKSIYFFSRSG